MDKIWMEFLEMSITAGFVILCILPVRWLLKKAPKVFSYALWAVVLFRLLCPITVSSSFSLLGLFQSPFFLNEKTLQQENIPERDVEDLDSSGFISGEVASSNLSGNDKAENHATENQNKNNYNKNNYNTDKEETEKRRTVAAGIWLIGAGSLFGYSLTVLWRLRRRLVGAVRLKENIWLADRIPSPFVLGIFRPKIYLPSTLSDEEQGYILLHEQTHIRRLDYLVKPAAFLTLCLHWFNPLVWLAFFLAVRDMEMSCDESVLRRMGTDIRCEYSMSLLNLTTGKPSLFVPTLAFGEGDTKARIRNVLRYKKPALWLLVLACVVVTVWGISLFCNPKPAESKEEQTSTNQEPEKTKWDLRPMILVNGVLYLDTGKPIPVEIAENAILGTVTGSVEAWEEPLQEGQTNFGMEGSPYAYLEDGVVVCIDHEWYFFEREQTEETDEELSDDSEGLMWVPTTEEAIYMALLDQNRENPETMEQEAPIWTAAWVKAGSIVSGKPGEEPDTTTYYIIGRVQEFKKQEPDTANFRPSDSVEFGDRFVVAGNQTLVWARISIKEKEDKYHNKFYRAVENWQTEAGETTLEEMKTVFPEEFWQKASGYEEVQTALTQECYAQAVRASGMESSVQTRIDQLVQQVLSSPAESSNPYDYVKAHPAEVEELIDYGEYTKQYANEWIEAKGSTSLQGIFLEYLLERLEEGKNLKIRD